MKTLQTLTKIITILIIVMICGCSNDYMTNKQWFETINLELNFTDDNYLDNLLAYNIIDINDKKNINQKLTNQTVKTTLTNITNKELSELGIIIESNNKIITKTKALNYLDICINYVNNLEFDNSKADYKLIDFYSEDSIDSNVIVTKNSYKENDIIKVNNNYYIVKNISKLLDENKVEVVKANYEDIIEYMNFKSSFEINFNDAEITDDNSEVTNFFNEEKYYQKLSTFSTYRQFQYQGYKIYYSLNGNNFHVNVAKETTKGFDIYNTFDISNVKANINWDYNNKKIENAYFRLDYKTTEAFGIKNTLYYDRFLDIQTIKDQKSLDNFTKLFKTKQELIETTIPIMKIKVPIPECPVFDLSLNVNLHMYASGRVAISLSSDNQTGFEIRNNKFRIINNHNQDNDFIIKASGATTIGIMASLQAFNFTITDLETAVGIKAYVKSTIHLFDDDNRYDIKSEIPADLLDQIAQNNSQLFVCADLSMYWVADVIFNSDKSLLSKLGYYHKISLLDEDNQILNNKTHLENWQFVDQCSYTNENSAYFNENLVLISDQIILQDYAILIRENNSAEIVVKALPSGYDLSDLKYTVTDSDYCVVNNGIVTAIKKGAATIKVSTKDNKYNASVSILIKDAS